MLIIDKWTIQTIIFVVKSDNQSLQGDSLIHTKTFRKETSSIVAGTRASKRNNLNLFIELFQGLVSQQYVTERTTPAAFNFSKIKMRSDYSRLAYNRHALTVKQSPGCLWIEIIRFHPQLYIDIFSFSQAESIVLTF